MGVLCDYFHAGDGASAVELAIGPGGDWLSGTSLEDAGADWIDAKGIDPDVVLAQLVAFVESASVESASVGSAFVGSASVGSASVGSAFVDGGPADGPELVWPDVPYPEGGSGEPGSPWETGLILQQLPDRWRDVLAALPEDAVPAVAARWGGIEELYFADPRDAEDAVVTFVRLAGRARAARAHLYCRCCV
ncbi:hypothetical protein AQJ30_35865 [Streptomyces longwoodensis]|uniref:Uncharacterized protein n=1 Tax=Streptomyces longwoodensis TaxID=68231 RepID=A0A124HPR8_9ACTN|nr:hypothetical protein [Streptomyces longwoodensis]KUN33057.1 hypothetical protein AQJ30_35865 [Streptomyces longwoodensis]